MTLWVCQAVDPAAGMSDRADFFAITTGAVEVETRRFFLLDVYKARHDTTEQPHIVEREYEKWKNPPYGGQFWKVGIESIFYQNDLFKHLFTDGYIPLYKIERRSGTGSANLSKYLRLLNLAGRYERGQIAHPTHKPPWLEDFESEMLSINYDEGKELHAHDDMVDAWAMCVDMLANLLKGAGKYREPTSHPFVYY
jgi:hypothetical protein